MSLYNLASLDLQMPSLIISLPEQRSLRARRRRWRRWRPQILKLSLKFLRPQFFLTLSPIWFIFAMIIYIGPKFYAVPSPAPLGHVKVKVTDLEFSC